MRPIIIDYAPVLTPQQVEKLRNFFHDVDEGRRNRAIRFIDRGVAVFNAMQSGEDKPNPVEVAKQVTRIKDSIEVVIKELNSLTPNTKEALNEVATKDHAFCETAYNVTERGLVTQLCNVQALCYRALLELPEVGKRGRGRNTDNKAGKSLAADILEAYAVAYDRVARWLPDDKSEVSPIYRILKLTETPAIIRQLIKKTQDIK